MLIRKCVSQKASTHRVLLAFSILKVIMKNKSIAKIETQNDSNARIVVN